MAIVTSTGDASLIFDPFFGGLLNVAGVVSASASEIVAFTLFDQTAMTLSGDFTYGPLNTVSGTVTGISYSQDGAEVATISDISVDAGLFYVSLINGSVDAGELLFSGDDTFMGSSLFDFIRGYAGNDIIEGKGGNDQLDGGGGSDRMSGGGGRDQLIGGRGDDALGGGTGSDFLIAGRGDDRVVGGTGDDTLLGGGGDDQLFGGAGDDLIDGGAGDDTLTGGDGADQFRYFRRDGNDTITDFEIGTDNIVFFGPPNSFDELTITQDGDDALISVRNIEIRLLNTMADDLSADDFSF